MGRVYQDMGRDVSLAEQEISLARTLALNETFWPQSLKDLLSISQVFERTEVQAYLQCNWYQDVLWFNKERFQDLSWWFMTVSLLSDFSGNRDKKLSVLKVTDPWRVAKQLLALSDESGYQVLRLLELASAPKRKPKKGMN